jgi:hypothetical protein
VIEPTYLACVPTVRSPIVYLGMETLPIVETLRSHEMGVTRYILTLALFFSTDFV